VDGAILSVQYDGLIEMHDAVMGALQIGRPTVPCEAAGAVARIAVAVGVPRRRLSLFGKIPTKAFAIHLFRHKCCD
jgi:hypothetical protein